MVIGVFSLFSLFILLFPPPSHVLMTSHDWLDMFVNGRRRRSSPRVAHLDERNFGVSLIAIQSPSISNKWNRQLRLCMVMMDFWNHLMKKSNVMTKACCYRVKWNFCWPNRKRIFQIFFVEITKTTNYATKRNLIWLTRLFATRQAERISPQQRLEKYNNNKRKYTILYADLHFSLFCFIKKWTFSKSLLRRMSWKSEGRI